MLRIEPLYLYSEAPTPSSNTSLSTSVNIFNTSSLYLMRLHVQNSSAANSINSLMNPKNLSRAPFSSFLMLDYGCIASDFVLQMAFTKALNQIYNLKSPKTRCLQNEILFFLAPTTSLRDAFKVFGLKDSSNDILIMYPIVHDHAINAQEHDKEEEEDRIRKQVVDAISEFVEVKEEPVTEGLGDEATIKSIYGSFISNRGESSGGNPQEAPRQILPRNVKPSHYNLTITPALETFEYSGHVAIKLDVVEPSRSITTNSKELTVQKAFVTFGSDSKKLTASNITFDADKETVEFQFDEEIPKGVAATLDIDFKGTHNDSMAGFYRSGYTDASGAKKYLVVTQFEATDCRRCFPSFDEPNLKATFDVTLIVPENRTALSNMPVIKDVKLEANTGLKSVSFATTPIMSTYLLAMCVGEFEYLEAVATPTSPASAKPIICRTYTLPSQKELGRFGLEVCVKTLEFFSKYFDVVYPLPKMDMIAIPDFGAGAMENWGLVTYRETALLYDPVKSSAKAKERVAYVVGHELAHQWFGNLVTMDWWSELWLNEGFATFVGWLAVDHIFPEWNVFTSFLIGDYARGVGLDALRSSHPIEVEVNSAAEIGQIFDAISYSKGASVIRMLNDSLGGPVFAKGVSAYLKAHSYGNATTTDLWDALAKAAAGIDVSKMMYAWTRKVGYPYLTITSETYNAEKKQMTLGLHQTRFLSSGDLTEAEEKECPVWHIPIPLVTFDGSEKKETVCHIDTKSGSITFAYTQSPTSFYKLNSSVSGFYRLNLSPSQLTNLSKALERDLSLFSTQDRIGLLSDVFAFARAGQASTISALSLLSAFTKERDQMVLEFLASRLASMKSIWFRDAAVVAGLCHLQRKIFVPIVKELGYEYAKGEDQLLVLKRNVCIAAAADSGSPVVVEELQKRFSNFLAGDKQAFHANLREPVFKTVLSHSKTPMKDFEAILALYTSSASTADEKIAALSSVGAVGDMAVIEHILAMVLETGGAIKLQDSMYPVVSLASLSPLKEKVLQVLWDWLVKNWSALHKSLSPTLTLLGRIVQACVSSNIGEDFALKVEAWARGDGLGDEAKADQVKKLKNVQRPLDQALEAMRGNTKWYETAKQEVAAYFASAEFAAPQ